MMPITVRPGHEAKYAHWLENKQRRGFTGRVKARSGKNIAPNVKAAIKTVNKNTDLYAWLTDAFYAGEVESFNVVDADTWTVGGATFTTSDLRRFATEDVAQAA